MRNFVGALSVVILLIWVIALYALRPAPIPLAVGLIFPTLTSIFTTSSSMVVTYVAVKAYARERLLNVLFLGCGALVFGSTSLLASMFLGSLGQNFSSTVFSAGALVAATFSLICASLTYFGSAPRLGGGRQSIVWVSVALLSVAFITAATAAGLAPPFFAAGTGTTLIDHVVLALATITFAASSILIFVTFSSSRSMVLFWYSIAIAATAAGLVGISVSNGDLGAISMRAGWATVYLGGVLFLTSVLSAERLTGLPKGKKS